MRQEILIKLSRSHTHKEDMKGREGLVGKERNGDERGGKEGEIN